MIPPPYAFILLALGAFRLTRLAGWDDLPPIAAARAWLVGEEWTAGRTPDLPGKTPDSEIDEVRPSYRRPLLAHFVACPWCIGAWISLGVYTAWLLAPHATLLVLVPFALSGVVGLIAKNLD